MCVLTVDLRCCLAFICIAVLCTWQSAVLALSRALSLSLCFLGSTSFWAEPTFLALGRRHSHANAAHAPVC